MQIMQKLEFEFLGYYNTRKNKNHQDFIKDYFDYSLKILDTYKYYYILTLDKTNFKVDIKEYKNYNDLIINYDNLFNFVIMSNNQIAIDDFEIMNSVLDTYLELSLVKNKRVLNIESFNKLGKIDPVIYQVNYDDLLLFSSLPPKYEYMNQTLRYNRIKHGKILLQLV